MKKILIFILTHFVFIIQMLKLDTNLKTKNHQAQISFGEVALLEVEYWKWKMVSLLLMKI